ncbi:hypothetical protein RvY_07133 [Ramazzottius varieornatus]|uniref:FACT complex subunit n=1 Tax=Ramazzottius varieornatus TaxID=947166 RepID=A0A1D1V656_RAMVA|nr:hypothetical protein RvY_07133 [Ramazzottius varieornatus]
MATPALDRESFFKRLKRVYGAWKKDSSGFAAIDSIFVGLMKEDDRVEIYSKSLAVHMWLFGYELADTLIVLCEDNIHIIASKKKVEFLKPLEKGSPDATAEVPPIKLYVKEKGDPGTAHFPAIFNSMKASRKGKTVGIFAKDDNKGESYDEWNKRMAAEGFRTSDISVFISYIMAPKDEKELSFVRKCSAGLCDLFKKFYWEEIMKAIESSRNIKHAKLSEMIDQAIKNKKYIPSIDKLDEVDMCFPAIIQSKNFKLRFSVTSDKENIHFGIICASFGIKYKGYCTNIARTIMVSPTKSHLEAYNIAYELEEFLIKKMEPGQRISDVYDAGVKWLTTKRPEFVDNVSKNFGFATGLEFRDSALMIAAKTTAMIRKGMVFCVIVGLENLKNAEGKTEEEKNFAIWLGDTIVINEKDAATSYTLPARKKPQQVSVVLDAEPKESTVEVKIKQEPGAENGVNGRSRRTVLTDRLRTDASTEERRKKHQQELADLINERALERLNNGKEDVPEPKLKRSTVAYRNINNFPTEDEVRELKIYVDRKNETVILPLFGEPVPFHISIIKSVATSVEGDYTYLRINFNHPGSAVIGGKESGSFANPEAQFVKELTFRSSNTKEPGELTAPSSNLSNAFRLIKEMQKKHKTREQEEREKEGVVQQDTLVLNPNKNQPRLKDLSIRPPLTQKRVTGSLEAHVNGFRYTTLRGEKVDVLYNNVKHAFFQPPEGEMIILLHFHLKNAIMYQKRKIVDIQFYTEVGELTTDLGKHYHMHDRDDLASEQAERELRNKLTTAFKTFTEKVETISRGDVDFDTPFRDLGFPGVPHRSTVTLLPTSTCLVNLSEWPPFVITLEQIELVHFERVQFHIKNFDMVFIFKDYTRKPVLVTAIPMNLLEHVKSWLDSCDIHYTEGIQSLNWVKIMKTIVEDPKAFIEDGGWGFLEPDDKEQGGQAAAEEEDEEDEEYNESASEEAGSEASDSEDYSDSEEVDEEEEEEDEEDLSSGEESGKDWDELEAEAAKADRQKAMEEEHEMRSMPAKRPAQRGGGGAAKKRR